MCKAKEDIYGKLGVQERYPLVQGYNISMSLIKLETTNIKGFSEVSHGRTLRYL